MLDLVQAALGLVSQEMRAISFQLNADRVDLYIAVRERGQHVDEDVEDLVFELEALQDGPVDIEPHIFVGSPGPDWPGNSGRRVYLAKEV
ncbi:hypothetical protein [Actinoplanes sp. NPDC051411]|uniref:hypothetical protein n=1 Tax=Actinoplanes sp. NPDC051411 TaxID=3155522 RepID=UPI00342FBBE9